METILKLGQFVPAAEYETEPKFKDKVFSQTVQVPWQNYPLEVVLIRGDNEPAEHVTEVEKLLNQPTPLFEVLDMCCRWNFEQRAGEVADNPPNDPMSCKVLAALPKEEYRKSYRIRSLLIPSHSFFSKHGLVISLSFETGWFDLSDKVVLKANRNVTKFECILYQFNSGADVEDAEVIHWSEKDYQAWDHIPS